MVFRGFEFGIAGGGDDADFDVAGEEVQEVIHDGREGAVGRGDEAAAVFVEGDVAVESEELEAGSRMGTHQVDDLRGVEDEADIVEGRGDEAARGNGADGVLDFEGFDEVEGGKESGDRWDEHD